MRRLKREALDAVWKKQEENRNGKAADQARGTQACSQERTDAQEVEGESLQKSLQSAVSKGANHRRTTRKSLK